MDCLEIMAAHRSVRRFRRAPLPDGVLERAVAAAQLASTSSHVQAYSLIRIRDEKTRERLAELAGGQAQVKEAGAFCIVCGDDRRHRLIAADQEAPLALNLETFLVAVIDASLFAQNLALALESLGYGICYIGGLRNSLPEVDRLLDLPEGVFPLFGLCAGEPDEDPKPRPRLPLEAVLLDDRYPDDAAMLAYIARFDEIMAEDYAAQGRPGRNWSGGIRRKFEIPRREDLAEYYSSKGARLR